MATNVYIKKNSMQIHTTTVGYVKPWKLFAILGSGKRVKCLFQKKKKTCETWGWQHPPCFIMFWVFIMFCENMGKEYLSSQENTSDTLRLKIVS